MPKKDWKLVVPEKFYNGNKKQPTAGTVRELKALLEELPDTMKIRDTWGNRVEVSVVNINRPTQHVSICDGDD